MVRLRLAVIFLLVAVIALPSCGRSTTPHEIVNALCNAELSLPLGTTYVSDSREGKADHLSPTLLASAYGIPEDHDGIISASIRLSSFGTPCEFAAFYCKSRAAAEDVALFCRSRIDTLRRNAASAAEFAEIPIENYLGYLDSSAVIISGRYVILIISSDTLSARRALYRVL